MELRRVAPALGLGALLVVDAALIAWAFRPTAAEVADTVVSVGSSASPTASADSSPSASATSPSPTPTPLSVRPLTRIVAATGGDVAWVADTGTCTKAGRVRVTTDRGKSWSSEAAPAQVLRVRPDSGTSAFVTGGDDACQLRLWSTRDGGASWGGAQSASAAWSRMPDDPGSVHLPNGRTATPCAKDADVVDLAVLDPRTALVLCDTGRVRTTTDAGGTWTATFTVKGALAIGLPPDGSAGVVVRGEDGCDGVVAVVVRGGEPAKDGACVESAPRSGRVAVTSSGSRWWLVSGDEVFTATKAEGPWSATKASLKSS